MAPKSDEDRAAGCFSGLKLRSLLKRGQIRASRAIHPPSLPRAAPTQTVEKVCLFFSFVDLPLNPFLGGIFRI